MISRRQEVRVCAQQFLASVELSCDLLVSQFDPEGSKGAARQVPQGRPRILVAKPGLDGHDRGIKVVARALRDAGMEVIYTGLHQTPEQIASAAIQEDVDAVGLSCLSGAHMTLFPRVAELISEQGGSDIVVFGGGIITDADIPKLKAAGISEIFTPGTPTKAIIDWVQEKLRIAAGREA
jgi:methylmalonyl-CoA mutase C-terminal domain/subunit